MIPSLTGLVDPDGYRLTQFGIPRYHLQILTKFFNLVHDDPGVFPPTQPQLRHDGVQFLRLSVGAW
jgi:hypothetical protein